MPRLPRLRDGLSLRCRVREAGRGCPGTDRKELPPPGLFPVVAISRLPEPLATPAADCCAGPRGALLSAFRHAKPGAALGLAAVAGPRAARAPTASDGARILLFAARQNLSRA